MLKENFNAVINMLAEVKGNGMYIAIYLIAILYIFIKEKNKNIKAFLVFYSVFLLIFVNLNPIFYKLTKKVFTGNVYWRLYWEIPFGITIAYAIVILLRNMPNKVEKILVTAISIVIIILSGKFVYNKDNFVKTSNIYGLLDEDVFIAYTIGADESEYKKAIVPEHIVAKIRQVDPSIKLAYGRDSWGYSNNEFVITLNSGDVSKITSIAKENACNFVVVRKAVTLTEKMEDYNFEKIEETENYEIYKYIE